MSEGDKKAFAAISAITRGNEIKIYKQEGLSKRELFAAMAMQGRLAALDVDVDRIKIPVLAANSVEWADALIKALENNHA